MAESYLSQHSLHQPLAAAVKAAITSRAEQPLRHIANSLLKEAGDDPKELSAAAELAELRREVTQLREENKGLRGAAAVRDAFAAQRAAGELRGVSAMNVALWKMGALRHEPPAFRYFDPKLVEQFPLFMKEVRLPFSAETHEVCYEPLSRCVFISQMSNCVLVRIPVGADGLLLDDQDAWKIGPVDAKGDGIAGLHNVSLSPANPGCLWLSLQLANQVMLIEAATMKVRRILICPSLLKRADGTVAKVGGPHCLRECGTTGRIHVALKGAVPCHPGEEVITAAGNGGDWKVAMQRVCCNPQALRERLDELEKLGYGVQSKLALTETYATWTVHPDEYDPKAAETARGGVLFECLPSPPMITIDKQCNLWVPQDRSETIMRVDTTAGATTQLKVPHPPPELCQMNGDEPMRITGPAIVTDPAGGVWCSLLGGNGALVRIDPATHQRTLYLLPKPLWLKSMRLIHMAFVKSRRGFYSIMPPHVMGKEWLVQHTNVTLAFAICSNLVDDASINALIVMQLSNDCKQIIRAREVPLPTQDCCCHRIAVLSEGLPEEDWSVVVSQLASSQLTQIKIDKMDLGPMFIQRRHNDDDGFEVREYALLDHGFSQTKTTSGFNIHLADKKCMEDTIYEEMGMVRCDPKGYPDGQEPKDGMGWVAVIGQGIWKGGADFSKEMMFVDIETEFVPEDQMYDDPLYPADAPRPDPKTGIAVKQRQE